MWFFYGGWGCGYQWIGCRRLFTGGLKFLCLIFVRGMRKISLLLVTHDHMADSHSLAGHGTLRRNDGVVVFWFWVSFMFWEVVTTSTSCAPQSRGFGRG